jgi:hypothetical protein
VELLLLVVVVVVELLLIGAVAEAFVPFVLALEAMAGALDIAELVSTVVVLVPLVETFALQAAIETVAAAAPTIRIVRSVPEVMSLVPSG